MFNFLIKLGLAGIGLYVFFVGLWIGGFILLGILAFFISLLTDDSTFPEKKKKQSLREFLAGCKKEVNKINWLRIVAVIAAVIAIGIIAPFFF